MAKQGTSTWTILCFAPIAFFLAGLVGWGVGLCWLNSKLPLPEQQPTRLIVGMSFTIVPAVVALVSMLWWAARTASANRR